MRAGKAPLISAILPTWNRADYLKKALKALTAQTLNQDEFEVIVVDDGSTDATHQIVDLFRDSLDLTYVHQDNAGIAVAKNRGIEQARAPLLLFMDDDDVAGPTLLEEHLWSHERCPDPAIAVLGRTELSSRVALNPVMHFVTEVGFYLFCYPRIPADESLDYTYFWGGRSSCKTSLLRNHGFFNPVFRFGCEDIELGYRLSKFGLRVVYNPRAVSTMLRALSFDDFCRRLERQGESNWVFSVIHPVEEVRIWADIPMARQRSAELEPGFESTLLKARHLDRIATLRAEEGLELDGLLVTELHKAYWQCFTGYRLRGILKAANEHGHNVPAAQNLPNPEDSRKQRLPCMLLPLELSEEQAAEHYREALLREDIGEALEAVIGNLYEAFLEAGTVAVDGGAHMALHTVPMARLVGPAGKVFAFEPIPDLVEYLQPLVVKEGLGDRIVIRALALSAHSGKSDFVVATDQLGQLGFSGLRERYYPKGVQIDIKRIKVRMSTLDEEVPADRRVSFIKLDLEGGEFDALRGANRILHHDRPILVFECGGQGSAEKYGYTSEEFFAFFAKHRYELSDVLGVKLHPALWTQMGIKMPWYVVGVPEERGWKEVLEVIQAAVHCHFPELSERLSAQKVLTISVN